MKTKVADKSNLKSCKAIRSALMSLLLKKTFENITIKELAEAAGVSRNTFYTHYEGVSDVMHDIENVYVSGAAQLFDDESIDMIQRNPNMLVQKINQEIQEKSFVYDFAFMSTCSSMFLNKLKNLVTLSVVKQHAKYLNLPSGEDAYWLVYFIVSGLYDTIQNWYAGGKTAPLERIAHIFHDFIMYGINCFVDRSSWFNYKKTIPDTTDKNFIK